MKKFLTLFMATFVCALAPDARAEDYSGFTDEQKAELVAQKTAELDTLKSDIAQIISEKARCGKQKKGWTAATIIGSLGVVATGTAAIVQGSKVSDKKDELKQLK
jgi:hypothetical protein